MNSTGNLGKLGISPAPPPPPERIFPARRGAHIACSAVGESRNDPEPRPDIGTTKTGCRHFFLTRVPTCHRKQLILVIRNRPLGAGFGLAVRSLPCQNSRSVVSRVILITAICRAWIRPGSPVSASSSSSARCTRRPYARPPAPSTTTGYRRRRSECSPSFACTL